MRHWFGIVIFMFWVAGCAAPRQYGNFLEHASVPLETGLARAGAEQLTKLYPPAATSFSLMRADDMFGRELSAALRRSGFAIIDGETIGSLSVRYVVDELGQNLFRIMLIVRAGSGAQSRGVVTSCAYKQISGALLPAGAWTRQTM